MNKILTDDKLLTITLKGNKTEKITDMSYPFSYCESLANLDLLLFNIQNVITMEYMFSG